MITLLDRLILFIAGSVMLYADSDNDLQIIYCLLGFIISCISYYFCEYSEKRLEIFLYLLIAVSVVFAPEMTPFFSVVLYSYLYKYWNGTIKNIFVLMLLAVIISLNIHINNIQYLWVLMILLVVSAVMSIKTKRLEKVEDAIKKLRDDSIEKNMILSHKNRYLAENQEKEVHIAVLSERNRISREIHDNVGHLLSRSILQVGALMAVNKDKNIEPLLVPVKNTLDEAMNSIRESVHDLYKESFDLEEAVKRILDELNGYNVEFEYDFSIDASKNVKYGFLTILKEAVTNIRKHSDGDKVYVVIRELDGYYQMVIEDNGDKIKSKKDSLTKGVHAGIGLKNMEDRVKNLSGIINFSYENGFRIFISVPKEVSK